MTAVLSQVDRNCCGCDEEQGNIKIQSSILVSKMFLEVTGIKVDQHYNLCKSCNQELKAAYSFRRRCLEIYSLYPDRQQTNERRDEVEKETEQVFLPSNCNPDDLKFQTHEKEDEVVESYEEELVLTTEDPQEVQDWEESICELKSPILETTEIETVEYLTDIKSRFQCQECSKTFAKNSALATHQLSHFNKRDFICPRSDCNSAFNVLSRLTRHLRTVHQANDSEVDATLKSSKNNQPAKKKLGEPRRTNDANPVQCDICLKVYSCVKYLKEHRILQHYSEDAPYTCEQPGCKKKFTDWSLLEKHQRAHEGLFDYKCQYCEKGYVQRKVLNQHLKKSHQISQEEIEEMTRTNSFCSDCNLKFKTPQQYSEHKALEHGNGERLFICDMCAKVFLSRVKLISHQKYHQDEKKMICSRCPSTFTEERGLKTHLRRVHKLTEGEIFETFLKH